MKRHIDNIFFAVGLLAVVVMFLTFDVSFAELWGYVTAAGHWLVAILALWVLLYFMNTLAWWVIIKGSGPPVISFPMLYKLTVSGFALNYATPIGVLGGEPYRIVEVSRYIGVNRGTSSVLLFAMMHIFSHFWFWVTAIVVYVSLGVTGRLPMNAAIVTVLVLASVFCCGGIYLFVKGYRNGMVRKAIRLVGKIPGLHRWATRFSERHKENLEKIDRQISELHSQNRRSFLCSLLLEYFGRMLQCFEIFFMLMLFDIDNGGGVAGYVLTYVYSFLILAFTSLFANLLGFLPLQLGGREGGFAMSVGQMGMTGEIAMFISIISRVRELFWTCIGLLLMKIGKKYAADAEAACVTEDGGEASPAGIRTAADDGEWREQSYNKQKHG